MDIVNFPLSGLAGLGAILTGSSPEEAADTVKQFQEKGFSQGFADKTFEWTGSPLLSATAKSSPEIVGAILPIARMSFIQKMKPNRLDAVLAEDVHNELVAYKQAKAQPTQPANNVQPSVVDPAQTISKKSVQLPPEEQALLNAPRPKFEEPPEMIRGAAGASSDPLFKEVLTQGFDSGNMTFARGMSTPDRVKSLNMLDILERRMKDPEYRIDHRPSDVVGDSLKERVLKVKAENTRSGKAIDIEAEKLKDLTVDVAGDFEKMFDDLSEMGIRIGDDGKIDFAVANMEGIAPAEKLINTIVKRVSKLNETPYPNAKDIHDLKRYIDKHVTFGKVEGADRETQQVFKTLRHNLNEKLKNLSDGYKKENITYSDTVEALDNLQTIAGKKLPIIGDHSEKALGQALRGLTSNNKSRIPLLKAVEEIQAVAERYGGVYPDKIRAQLMMVNEIEKRFGSSATTSFRGEIAKAGEDIARMTTGQTTLLGGAISLGKQARTLIQGVSDENAIKALRELLQNKQ